MSQCTQIYLLELTGEKRNCDDERIITQGWIGSWKVHRRTCELHGLPATCTLSSNELEAETAAATIPRFPGIQSIADTILPFP
jgi:hypothetical protein